MMSAEQPSRRRKAAQLSLPYWVVSGAILVGAVVSILVGALTGDEEVAKIFQTAVTPILTLFAGGVFNDLYHRLGEDRHLTGDVKKSADATLIMLQNVLSVERWIAGASNNLNERNREGASASIQVALAMTAVTLQQVRQNLRLWGSLSPEAVEQARAEFQADEGIAAPQRQQIAMPSDDNQQTSNNDREAGDGNG